jgi:Domain of unknown function (DUF5664)
MSMSEGFKLDSGKLRFSLIPWDAVRAIGKVFQWACSSAKAVPYPERNWEQGMDWNRPFDALIRHLTDWWDRDPHDPESGFSHLWHAGCCLFMLISWEIRGIGRDNRPPRIKKRRSRSVQLSVSLNDLTPTGWYCTLCGNGGQGTKPSTCGYLACPLRSTPSREQP